MDFTKQTYCNQVTSYIRSLIRKGTLEIGAPVKEAVLSEQLGISRAPIREALQVLVQEGRALWGNREGRKPWEKARAAGYWGGRFRGTKKAGASPLMYAERLRPGGAWTQ